MTTLIPTWQASTIEGTCHYDEETPDIVLAEVKELLTKYSCALITVRRTNDSLLVKFVS